MKQNNKFIKRFRVVRKTEAVKKEFEQIPLQMKVQVNNTYKGTLEQIGFTYKRKGV